MKFIILISFIFLNSLSLFSQKADTSYYYFTGFQAQYGLILPHAPAIEPVSHTNPYGFDLSINRLHTNYESWKVFNHFNISGFQLSYINFQNPDVLGEAVLLTMFSEPVWYLGRNFVFSAKGGTGLAYISKVYDDVNNPTNKFFSTHFSFPLYLQVKFKYRISQKTFLTLSGSYNHISNGAVKVPNYGMNFPTMLLGIEHFQMPLPDLNGLYTKDRNKKVSGQYLIFQLLTGYKVVYSEPQYAIGLSTRYTWQIRQRYALNAGAELIMDQGIKKMIEIENLSVDYKRFAITAGQDLILGKVYFTMYFGYYLYSPYKAYKPVYEKYELSYKITPQFSTGFYLKAHTKDAELMGLQFNYLLRIK
jgi:hypothetical protein